jgi:hypothetical protein
MNGWERGPPCAKKGGGGFTQLGLTILVAFATNAHSSTDGMPDTLQALFFLRFCAAIAIPASGQLLSSTISEAFLRVLIKSVHDKRCVHVISC